MIVTIIAIIPLEAMSVVAENIIYWKVMERAVEVCVVH